MKFSYSFEITYLQTPTLKISDSHVQKIQLLSQNTVLPVNPPRNELSLTFSLDEFPVSSLSGSKSYINIAHVVWAEVYIAILRGASQVRCKQSELWKGFGTGTGTCFRESKNRYFEAYSTPVLVETYQLQLRSWSSSGKISSVFVSSHT